MRKAALGIGIGAALIIVMYVGRLISYELSGANWPIRSLTTNFRDLPEELGDWTVIKSGNVRQDVFIALGAVDAEDRVFQNSNNNEISYHAAVFEEFTVSPAHTPQQCYPANGWESIQETVIEVPLSDKTTFKPTLITFEKKGGEKAFVLYWFQLGDFVVTNSKQQRIALEHYRPDGKWPSVFKAMLHMPITANYQNEEPIKDLAGRIYEYTRTLQDGKASVPLSKKAKADEK